MLYNLLLLRVVHLIVNLPILLIGCVTAVWFSNIFEHAVNDRILDS